MSKTCLLRATGLDLLAGSHGSSFSSGAGCISTNRAQAGDHQRSKQKPIV